MKAYSTDLRERVLRAANQGKPRKQIVQDFNVSLATIKRYVKQRREQGHVRPKPIPGRRPIKRQPLDAGLESQLQAYPDTPLQQHCEIWEQTHGQSVSRWTMSRAIKELGWTRKKSRWQKAERNQEQRASWDEQIKPPDASQFVFVDECGSNIALTPLYARAPKGQRVHDHVRRNRGKHTTLIASLTSEGVGASMILEGATNGAAFEIYVEQILVASLHQGQVVIMDNLRVHKSARVRQLIEEAGAELLFLPAYSPDFSPIEETFAKVKAFLRRSKARTKEALEEAIAQALLSVTSQDARGWFHHCGYWLPLERQS